MFPLRHLTAHSTILRIRTDLGMFRAILWRANRDSGAESRGKSSNINIVEDDR